MRYYFVCVEEWVPGNHGKYSYIYEDKEGLPPNEILDKVNQKIQGMYRRCVVEFYEVSSKKLN